MKTNTLKLLLPTAAVLILAASAQAQGPGGFGGPGGPGGVGGTPPPPAVMAKMQAWRQWRDNHKNVTALQRSIGALSQMEQDPRTALTKPQARAILAVIKKWQGKTALTDEQARQVNTQLTTPLSLMQIKKIAMASQNRGGGRPGGGGGFGGGGRPGGPGGPGGRPGFDPASFPAPHEYNPLNPNTLPFVRQRQHSAERLSQLVAMLAATK